MPNKAKKLNGEEFLSKCCNAPIIKRRGERCHEPDAVGETYYLVDACEKCKKDISVGQYRRFSVTGYDVKILEGEDEKIR